MNDEQGPSFAMQLGSTALALVLVLALAWLLLRLLKRWQLRSAVAGGGHAVQIVHSLPLGPRERLVTVHWRGREYLLGVSAGAVQRIADVPLQAGGPTADVPAPPQP